MKSRSWALVIGFVLVCLLGLAGLWLERRGDLPSLVALKSPTPGVPLPRVPTPSPVTAAPPNRSREAAETPKHGSEGLRPATAANQPKRPFASPAPREDDAKAGAASVSPTDKPAPSASSPTASGLQDTAAPPKAPDPAIAAASPAQRATATTSSGSTGAGATPPRFDVVRVEPSGDTVLAGRAAPGSKVALLASGKVIAEARADAGGGFVMVPTPLKPGGYDLTLRQQSGQQSGTTRDVISRQSVAVSVPKRGGGPPMVALAEPGKATRLLSGRKAGPVKVANAPSTQAAGVDKVTPGALHPDLTPKAPAAAPKLAFRSVDLENGDGFYATGVAAPDTHIEVYLNNSRIAGVIAAPDGQWSVKVLKGLMGGRYVVRADAHTPGREVSARAEVPFDVPEAMAAARKVTGKSSTTTPVAAKPVVAAAPVQGAFGALSSPPTADVSGGSAAGVPSDGLADAADRAVIQALETARVVNGDNLWRISRTRLGLGHRYTQIYAANAAQIRDPNLIYPDQVLVMPRR